MTPDSSGKVRIGIIGAGGISRNHVRGILASPDRAECVALCDISDDNIAARDQELGASTSTTTTGNSCSTRWAANLTPSSSPSPTISMPPASSTASRRVSTSSARSPCASVSPKPTTSSRPSQPRASSTCRPTTNLFGEAVQAAKRMLDAGEIGRLYWLRSQDCFLAGGGERDPFHGTWRAKFATQGGGELIDTGYHPTYRLLYLANSEIVSIRGTMGRFAQHIEGEDTASVVIAFANGAMGEIFTSWAMPLPYGSYEIHLIGEKGQIFGTRNDMWILRDGASEPEKIELADTDQSVAQMDHFLKCIQEGARPIHGPEEGRQTLQIILKAAESAEGWQQHAQV